MVCENSSKTSYLMLSDDVTQKKYVYMIIYVGLSPLPVIVEMKVYRDSLLKM